MRTLSNFIDGAFRPPLDGATEPVLNPATGEEIAQAPLSGAADVEAAVSAARRAFERVVADDAGDPRRRVARARGRDRGSRRGTRPRGGDQRRQAARRRPERRDRRDGRQPPLLRRRGALHGGQGSGRVPGGPHLDDSPRAGRRDRPDHPVELPAADGGLEDRPRARTGNTIVLKPAETTPITTLRLAELAPRSFRPACSTSSAVTATPPGSRSSSTPTSTWSR